MRTSSNLLKFACCREAFVSVAYEDGIYKTGPMKGQPAYSYEFGMQTTIEGKRVKLGDTSTIEAGLLHVRSFFDSNDKVMNNLIKVDIQQHEWDAAASLFYQSGIDEIREVSGWFNAGVDIIDIAEGLLQWNYVTKDGKKMRLKGLSIRRTREELLMKAGEYGDISRYRYYDGDPAVTTPVWKAFPDVEI